MANFQKTPKSMKQTHSVKRMASVLSSLETKVRWTSTTFKTFVVLDVYFSYDHLVMYYYGPSTEHKNTFAPVLDEVFGESREITATWFLCQNLIMCVFDNLTFFFFNISRRTRSYIIFLHPSIVLSLIKKFPGWSHWNGFSDVVQGRPCTDPRRSRSTP